MKLETVIRHGKTAMREQAGELREQSRAFDEMAGQLETRWDRDPEVRDGFRTMARWAREGAVAMRERAKELDEEADGRRTA